MNVLSKFASEFQSALTNSIQKDMRERWFSKTSSGYISLIASHNVIFFETLPMLSCPGLCDPVVVFLFFCLFVCLSVFIEEPIEGKCIA